MATDISFTNIQATWFSPVGGNNISYVTNGQPNSEIRWGNPSGNTPKSGYGYTSIGNLNLSVDPMTDTSAVTNIGQFTHFNFPINSGSGISSVKLQLTTDVLVDNVLFGNVSFVYAFNHTETSNNSNPCANGGPNNAGVNVNGCADRVEVNFNQESGFFTIDNVDYALDVRGFLVDDDPADLFWTTENRTNEAFLRGQVVLRTQAGAVPEPATWAMMIGGLGLVGASLRRRAVNVKFA